MTERIIKFRAWVNNQRRLYEDGIRVPKMEYSDDQSMERFGCLYMDSDDTTVPVMQFTGLPDKNGKEIFESDIVNINSQVYGKWNTEVFFCNELGYYAVNNPDSTFSLLSRYSEDSREVIGNIYEDKEKTNPIPNASIRSAGEVEVMEMTQEEIDEELSRGNSDEEIIKKHS